MCPEFCPVPSSVREFCPENLCVPSSTSPEFCFRLSGMRERFEELGGTLAVGTAGVGGLRLQASLPLNSHGAAD